MDNDIMMNFEDFAEEVKDKIGEYLSNFDIEEVIVKDIEKTNGLIYKGLMIKLYNEDLMPNIYLDYYYNLYKANVSFDLIMLELVSEYKNAREKINEEVLDFSKEGLNERAFIKIVNYEKNKNILKDCPYIPFYDLAITFRYLVKNDSDSIASAIISNYQVEAWDLNIEELYKLAKENTKKLFPPVIKPLADMLEEMTGKAVPKDVDIFVLTNERCVNGASSLIFSDWLEEFGECLGNNFYILPSSMHECLLVPDLEINSKLELKTLVIDVNSTVLDEEDYLSDNVYYYDLKSKMVSVCDETC